MYFIPYIIFIAILYIFYLSEKKRIKLVDRKVSVACAYLVAFVFIGLRGHIMSDFIIYYPYFHSVPILKNLTLHQIFNVNIFEPGFFIYTSLVKTIYSDYFFWVAVNTIIDLTVFYITFKRYCSSVILPLIFLIVFQGFTVEFNLFRNAKSIDLFLLSLPYLQRRSFLPYIGLNLLGVTFHTSAILYIPLYFLLTLKIKKWIIWGGVIGANVIFLFKLHIVGAIIGNIDILGSEHIYDKLSTYAKISNEFRISFGYIERTISLILFSWFYSKLIKENTANNIFYNCFWIYYVLFMVFYEVQVFVERVPLLFIFSYWILYPNIMVIKTKYRKWINSMIWLLTFTRAVIGFNNVSMEYQNILWHKPNYEKTKKVQLGVMRKAEKGAE